VIELNKEYLNTVITNIKKHNSFVEGIKKSEEIIDLDDIQYHTNQQGLELNIHNQNKAFENIGYKANEIYSTIYDVIESRIKSDKVHKILGIEYKSIEKE